MFCFFSFFGCHERPAWLTCRRLGGMASHALLGGGFFFLFLFFIARNENRIFQFSRFAEKKTFLIRRNRRRVPRNFTLIFHRGGFPFLSPEMENRVSGSADLPEKTSFPICRNRRRIPRNFMPIFYRGGFSFLSPEMENGF